MDWLSALWRMNRNGRKPTTKAARVGVVPIVGHGGLTDRELASAGASMVARADVLTIDELMRERERLEAFVERQVDPQSRNLRGSYWDLQSAETEANEEARAMAVELARLGRVEGAAVVGWIIRNAALRV